ncbi:MAG: sulfotransferase domain-containing protein [bacterium]|nr:sulfotransferase domain-containing protein [bacterium]
MFMAKNFKVDFICIGPERSGTTWLYQCLKEHPDFCLSEPKEINFFNSSQSFWRKDMAGETNYTKGLEWYQKHFGHCPDGKIVGEITPAYIHSQEVPERIVQNFPDVKLIAILRNPIERLYSHYMYTKMKGFYELPSFEEVIEKEKAFVEESAYFKHLQNYLKYFSKKKILITIFEDIEGNPEVFIKEILSFLGADDTFIPPSTNKTINSAGAVAIRNKVLSIKERIADFPGGLLMIELFKKTPFHKKMSDSLATKTGTVKAGYGKIDQNTKKRLAEFYKEDIENLEKLLDRDLSVWKE